MTMTGRGGPVSTPAVRTEGLTKRYGHVLALDSLDLTVPAGEVFGFLGPNGAGKSTTIRLLLGLARPTAGRAWIFDDDAADVEAAHRRMAHVPADVTLWPALTGAETLELLARTGPGIDRAYRDELVERFELDLSRPGRTYSTGNRQKVALVAAFATRAPLLVLDEPTAGLDPLMEREFQRAVAEARERGQTVFLSSHLLAEVEAVCDRVAILRAGRLVEVAGISDLRQLHRTEVEVTVAGPAPDLTAVPGVEAVEQVGPARLRFSLTGAPAAALRALAEADVTALEVREPSLEEIFLAYYGAPDGGAGGGAGGVSAGSAEGATAAAADGGPVR
ncbi:MAG TPA: ABC transporter ATP-binding protein [Pseudonocardia sp.]|nr:ABC transporter ATP-binding protein [Pseudonocardia sp.]